MPEPNENDTRRKRIAAAYDAEAGTERRGTRVRTTKSTPRPKRRRFYVDANIVDLKLLQLLTGTELKVYLLLCRYADKERRVRISQPMVADALDMGERTVRRNLASLESLGLIRKWQSKPGTTGHIRLRDVRKAAPTLQNQRHGT